MYSLFVGIDVSKDSFSVAGLNDKAKILFSMCPLMNAQGFSEFLKVLTSYQKDLSSVVVALESTGSYHLNLYSFLVSKNITTIVVNPLIIANFTKLSLRKTKTDKKDALTIARFLFLNRDSISQLPSTQLTTDLRDLARERESIIKMIAWMKNDIRRLLQSTFPELEQPVDVLSDTMLCFLKVFPSARLITAASPRLWQRLLTKAMDGEGSRPIIRRSLILRRPLLALSVLPRNSYCPAKSRPFSI